MKYVPIYNAIIKFSFYLLFILVPLILTPWNYELFEFKSPVVRPDGNVHSSPFLDVWGCTDNYNINTQISECGGWVMVSGAESEELFYCFFDKFFLETTSRLLASGSF